MSRSLARHLLGGSLVLVAVSYAGAFLPGGAPDWAPWALLVGSVTALAAISLLGAGSARAASDRRLLGLLAVTSLLLVTSIGAGLLLPPPEAGSPLFGGLPPGAALMVYGAGLLPLLLVPLGYAWVFPQVGFGEGDLERLRDEARRAREDGGQALADGHASGGEPVPATGHVSAGEPHAKADPDLPGGDRS